MKKRITSKQVDKIADKFLSTKTLLLALAILMLLACVIASVILIKQLTDPICETQINELQDRESLLRENFSNLPTLDNVEAITENGTVIVTFYEKDCKLIVVYDEYLDVISSEIKNTKALNNLGLVFAGCFMFVFLIFTICSIIIAACFDIVIKIKEKQEKAMDKGANYEKKNDK